MGCDGIPAARFHDDDEHDSHKSSRLGTSIAAEIEDYLNFKPVPSASPASRSRSRASSARASSSEFACTSSPPPLPSRDAVNFQDASVCQQRRGSMMAAKFRLGEQVIVLKQLDRKWVVREGMVVHVHIESPTQDRFYSVQLEDSGDRIQVDESNLVECPSESANVLFRTQTYLLDVRHAVKGAEALATRVESASRDPQAHASLATLERKMSQSLETLTRWTSFVPPVDDWDALSFAAAEAREMLVAEARKLIVNAEVNLYLARGRLSFNTDRNQEALADAKAALERAPDDKAAALLRSMALFNLSENTATLERTSSGASSSDGSSSSSSPASPMSELVSAFSDAADASPDTTTTSTVGPSMEKSLGPDSDPREEEEEVGEDAGNETSHCGVSYLDEDDALATTHKGAPKEVVNRPVLPAWQGGHAQGSHTLGESIVQEIDQYLCALDAEAVLERWQAANRSSPGGITQYGASGDSDDDTGRFIL
ncbi:Hypothetical Protein FCC1311_007492 [Hondaea fermentalgiana]|uniref:Uncharacterized protein n=1 Tax=Hondaea fermentalgiana TaxID=2315210 RepID=A0A2R5G0K3_9STRA|nr:Hypothetical Protein FCC1311_007492 [Hondaea fermentalgiana]|eukprot:GBG24530.1 Hypothetical Protein FCC1311_007492 [Hondaea fermentalgiana]